MKNLTVTIIIACFLAKAESFAQTVRKPALNYTQKLKVALAIRTLIDAKVIHEDLDQCLQLDQDIFDLLNQGSLLEKGGTKSVSICPDAGA